MFLSKQSSRNFSKVFLNSSIKLKANFKFEEFIFDKKKETIKKAIFINLKNKELNEGFEESVYSKKTGKKLCVLDILRLPSKKR